MKKRTKTLLVAMLLALASLACSIGVATSYAAEVGYIQHGDRAEDFKLYEVGDNLFQTELPHEILSTFFRNLNYQAGYRLDNGGEYYPITDYPYHMATWRYTQSYSDGILGDGQHYVYIEHFNPDFPTHTDPNQPEGKQWHNTVYLYAGDLDAGRYMLRNTYQKPYGVSPSGVLIPDDSKAFKLLVSLYDRNPDTGEVDWNSQTSYAYPNNAVFDVEEGQYVVIYYTFYAWDFEWYQSLGVSLYFSYKPQLYPLTEISPGDLVNGDQTFEELMASMKWENYEDGYQVGYSEGFLAGSDEGYKSGYAAGHEDGYASGYDYGTEIGHGAGYIIGRTEGLTEGRQEGYTEGHQVGYDAGYDIGEYNGYYWGLEVGHTEGYTEGYTEGHTEGYAEGHTVGHTEGYAEGYDAGEDDGYEAGHARGYDAGYDIGEYNGYQWGLEVGDDQGYRRGLEVGDDQGYRRGLEVGDDQGYRRGVQDLDTAGGVIGSFISSVWDILVDAVKIVSEGTTFNGISISGIVFTAIGIFVIGFIISKLRG